MIFKNDTHPVYRLLALLFLTGLSISALGFSRAPGSVTASAVRTALLQACPKSSHTRNLALDGVALTLCLPFAPENVVTASKTDLVQSALALNQSTGQELFIYAVPYGLRPASDYLPIAQPGGSAAYQDLSFKAYDGEVLAEFDAPPVNMFGQQVLGRSVVIANKIGTPATGQQMITQWVVEAGKRIWLVRLVISADSFTGGAFANEVQPVGMVSTNLGQPSTSLELSREPLSSAGRDLSVAASDLPFPSWWSGDCDVNNFSGSYPLGSSFRGVKTCGPFNTMHLVNFGAGFSQYEWQCVEYVKRYLYLAYGIAPYSANGNTVVWNYIGTRLEKVTNGTPNKGPFPGDVISFDGPSTYGHTVLVSAAAIDANGNGTITIAEQNYSKTGTRTLNVSGWSIQSNDQPTGWLHDNHAANNPPAGYVKCAEEGGKCTFSGTASVVYGALSSFSIPRLFTSDVDCSNAVFGDPLGGVTKACYFLAATPGDQTAWAAAYYSGSTHWLDPTDITNQMCTDTVTSAGLDKDYSTGAPCSNGIVDDWTAEYNATVNFPAGNYIFQTQNDDGIKVWVNGQSLFDRSGSASLSSVCPALSLNGDTAMRVILREVSGAARVRLLWTTDPATCTLPGAFGKAGPANGATSLGTGPTLRWNMSQNVIGYSYCVDTTNNNTCDTGWQNAGISTGKTLSGLAYSTKYYWQVRANNSGGQTQADTGAWWSFTTMLDPATCYSLTLSHTGSGADPVGTPANAAGCPAGNYHTGDVVSLKAQPGDGNRVGTWTGTNNNAGASDFNALTMPARAYAAGVNYIQAAPLTPITISPTGKVINDFHPIYKWYAVSGATSYLVTLYNADMSTLVFNNVSVPASNCSGVPSVCSYHPLIALGNFDYAFIVAAANSTGTSPFSTWRSFYMARVEISFVSVAAQDGMLRESTETSGVANYLNNLGTVFYAGDDSLKRQLRSFMAFNTSSLPDNAVILSATLKLTRQGIVGVNPFTTHGSLLVDIRKPYFGATSALQLDDFGASASLTSAGVVSSASVNGVHLANLASNAYPQINLLGLTQFRLRFQLDDDNDSVADYVAFFSGDSGIAVYRPVLVINYYLP